MERVFAMPDLGEGLEEGRIVEWLVAAGDDVALNQPLVEVETAKAAVEIPSPFEGTVATLHGSEGEEVPVGSPLVTFELESTSEAMELQPEKAIVRSREAVIERRPDEGPVKATPPTRKLARDLGVDLATVRPTGSDGRITEQDVRRAARWVEEGVLAVNVGEDLRSDRIPVDLHRRAVAENLTEQARIPQVTTFRTLDCLALQRYREELEVSPLPIVVAALCAVIRDHPMLNAVWGESHIERRGKVNVAIAVDTERGLSVPVVQDAGRRGIADLARELDRVVKAARSGTQSLEDHTASATIAVSNTGSYGSEAGTPILSPGTGVTVAFGVIEQRALVVDGQVVARPAATISLTFDHRVLDGAAAGRALTDLVALLESPERLGGLPR
jgi:2-oxoisovalerate dehydrogenase E2 component (dihydrolipoyl transacylase)